MIVDRFGDWEVTQEPVDKTVKTPDGKEVHVTWKITGRYLGSDRPPSELADGSSEQQKGGLRLLYTPEQDPLGKNSG